MKNKLKLVLGLFFSVMFFWLISKQIDIKQAVLYFSNINLKYIAIAALFYLISFIFRSTRWDLILIDEKISFFSLLETKFFGFAANSLLPARAGEFYKAYYLGKKEKISKSKIFSSIIFERFLDGFVLFILLVLMVNFVFKINWLMKLSFLAGVVFFGGMIAMFAVRAVFKGKTIPILSERLNEIQSNIINGLAIFSNKKEFVYSLILSLIIWFFEAIAIFYIIKSFGLNLSFMSSILILTVTAFCTLIPAGPSGLGPYNWGYIKAMNIFGVLNEEAFAISIVNQLFILVVVCSISLLFYWKNIIKSLEK